MKSELPFGRDAVKKVQWDEALECLAQDDHEGTMRHCYCLHAAWLRRI